LSGTRGEPRPHDGESGESRRRSAEIDQPSDHTTRENQCFAIGVPSPAPDHALPASKTAVNRGVQMNQVDPHAWLTRTLERIANGWPNSDIDALMPWNYQS
jgi:hypothetical protein